MSKPLQPTARELVDELLQLDPTLAGQRDELERKVSMIVAGRPDATLRPAFERELLTRLRGRMNTETAPTFSFLSIFSLMNNRFIFAGAGTVVGALVVLAAYNLPLEQALTPDRDSTTQEQKISGLAPEAFGPLGEETQTDSGVPAANPAPGLGGDAATMSSIARPQSGGGGGGMGMVDEKMMIAPDYTQLRFTYDGDIELPTSDVTVYRRVKPGSMPGAGSAITGFADGMLNWGKLGGLKLQNVSLVQSGSEPYSVYIDYAEGSVSINKMYNYANRPESSCTTEECFNRFRLKESDMLSDEETFSIARKFLSDFGIDASQYGEPQLSDNWQIMYARSSEKMAYWFPEQVNVVFPLKINGMEVYESYGNAYGLSVSVDMRSRSVSSMYNNSVQNFDESTYAPATDEAAVRKYLEQGNPYAYMDPSAKFVDVKLGEPKEVLMHHYDWNQSKQTSQELFVPALSFPVLDVPAGTYDNRTHIVVPLAAELLKVQDGGVYPMPMPLMEEDGGGPAVDVPAAE